MIHRIVGFLLVGILLVPRTGHGQDLGQTIRVREVPDSSLRDVAVAVSDPLDPVIYYNPRLMDRFGPNLSAFVLAHEYGHIRYGHRRVPARVNDRNALMREYELEADCYAARLLARVKPAAGDAAVEFFRKMGDFRYDDEHPTGTERAGRIERCLRDRVPAGEGLSVGLGRQVIASLRRIPGEPGSMAMLKSEAKQGTRKATRRSSKPEALPERALEME